MAREVAWIALAVIEALHDRLLAEHGGAAGLRDGALLKSAMARPQHLATYDDPDLCALAAAYAAGIVRNHPFVDGNKRTAFMAAYVFLARNGLRLTAPEDKATYMMRALAAGDIDEATFAVWLRDNTLGVGP
ncbi:death-on-curing family protein [Nitrosococcus halophilus Nc 4]|uniref:Death-on-curing family protein n=1 Tax=Nitrosococcus halophilus (strain Nc4) TaxID=472759 RepID=D5C0U1_NITHN|nr:type II toxin-antitoxin system death-on-curing family toxin [Nitrosococcus halophilus]ADE16414.1 death-on-curing family protein [Nitrosococcus halophilus Nc 4]